MGRAVRYSVKEEELLEATYQQNGAEYSDEHYGTLAESMGYTKKQLYNWYKRRRDRDENIPPKRRFTLEQKAILEAAYQKNQTPNKTEIQEIAKMLNIEEVERVRHWFQSRRYPTMKIQNPAFLYSIEQKKILVAAYLKNRHPKGQELVNIAEEVGAPLQRVRSWFLNRRSQVTRYNWNPEQEKLVLAAYQENRKPWASPMSGALSPTTSKLLEDAFEVNPQPTSEELQNLHEKTKLDVSRITFWFDRKRLNTKKQAINEKLRSQEQFHSTLEETYQKNKYRTTKELNELADEIGEVQQRVRSWFRYRRMKDKEYRPHIPVNKPMKRRTPEEIIVLNEAYQKSKSPDVKVMSEIADRIGIKTSQVISWFSRKKKGDRDYEKKPSAFDANTVHALKAAYQKNPRPSAEEMEKVAEIVNLTLTQVTGWFGSARRRFGCPNIQPDALTTKQKDIISKAHEANPYPSEAKKEELANRIGLTRKRVSRQFYVLNRRKKTKVLSQKGQEEESGVKMEDVGFKIKVEQMDSGLGDKDEEVFH